MPQAQVRKQTFPCDLCQEPVEITFAEGATEDSIKDIRKVHNHCAGGMNEDGTLKPMGQWLDEIKMYRQNKEKNTNV